MTHPHGADDVGVRLSDPHWSPPAEALRPCSLCSRDDNAYTPMTCPIWARHPILGYTGDGNPPPGWDW